VNKVRYQGAESVALLTFLFWVDVQVKAGKPRIRLRSIREKCREIST
jgi:hypothetical protein